MAVLTTARLRLRRPEERDLDAIDAFHRLSGRAGFVGETRERFESWRMLLSGIGHWTLRGFGWFTVEETATGAIVGRSGISLHDGFPEPELGWHVFDGHLGRGFATEAATAARDWYRRTVSDRPLISMIDARNHASRRVAERLGARYERTAEIIGHVVDVWRHPEVPA